MTITISRKVSTGADLEVGFDGSMLIAHVTGQTGRILELAKPQGDVTHYATIAGKSYGITQDEYQAARAARDADPRQIAIDIEVKAEIAREYRASVANDKYNDEYRATERRNACGETI